MPVTFLLDSEHRAIISTATGMLGRAEILEHLKAKSDAGVLGFAELFDARDVTLDLSVSDLQTIADDVREAMGATERGKTAVVTNNNFIYGIAATYKALTSAQNLEFEVFRQIDDARSWVVGGRLS